MENAVAFDGYYGMKNTGDNAFIEVAAWGAKKFWNVNKTTFLTPNMPLLKSSSSGLSSSKFNGHTYMQKLYEVFSSTHFVSAGGSIFHSNLSIKDIRRSAISKKKIKPNYIVGAVGVSIGPFKNASAEKYIINYLREMDFLALRDKKSYEIASSFNLPYKPIEAFDLAALLPDVYGETTNFKRFVNPSKKVIGISLCNYECFINGDIKNQVRRNKRLIDLISILSKNKTYHFRFFLFNGHTKLGDESLTLEAISSLRSLGAHAGVIDHLRPEQIDHLFCWRRFSVHAC